MVNESNKIKNNQQQQQSIIKNDPKIEVEIDTPTSNKLKTQEQKNPIRRTSGGQKKQEQISPPPNNLTTIQQEIKDLPRVTLSKTTKTPSKDLTDQDPNKSLDEPAMIHEANDFFAKISNKVDPKYINEIMKKVTQEKRLPEDSTNLIISQQIQLGKLWKSRLIQMISIDDELINQIYKNTGLNNRKIRKNTKYVKQRSSPILFIIRLIIQNLQKKNDEKDKITLHTYAVASLITMTIQEYLTKCGLITNEEKMNVEDFQMIIMNTFQKGAEGTQKMNHIIQLNKDENSPTFAAINIARDNVSKFTKQN